MLAGRGFPAINSPHIFVFRHSLTGSVGAIQTVGLAGISDASYLIPYLPWKMNLYCLTLIDMELIAFTDRIDNAIRRKLQPTIDPVSNQFTDLSAYQKESIINIYTEFVQMYSNEILNYLDEATSDNAFVDWCEESWATVPMKILSYHTHANILYATVHALTDAYMRYFKATCEKNNTMSRYERRLADMARYLEILPNSCAVQ